MLSLLYFYSNVRIKMLICMKNDAGILKTKKAYLSKVTTERLVFLRSEHVFTCRGEIREESGRREYAGHP